jgi:amidophosphoribosyltransferase
VCGIVGIVAHRPVNQALYDALTVLQHRGQDAAGINTDEGGTLYSRKALGLVRDVFQERHMLRLRGNMGIGHTRYPTAGCSSSSEAQPFYVNSPYGICLAHNGNLTNATELKELLVNHDRRHLNTGSDTEALLNVFADELQRQSGRKLTPRGIFAAVSGVHRRCRGGYAVVAMILGHGIVAFRDPDGIRPVCLGRRDTMDGPEYIVASESVALDALDFELVRDILPGEAVYIEADGELHSHPCGGPRHYTPCVFEFVYFARPDSIIDRVSVYKSRLRMGERLAEKILRERPGHDIDVVIPIPDSSRTSALEVAHRLGVKYREGFIKNRYIGRTFIQPDDRIRRVGVHLKYNPLTANLRGKRAVLVDDSVVRGNTIGPMLRLLREGGATEVHVRVSSPPVQHPCFMGIDMATYDELIAHRRTVEEIRQHVGADTLAYLSHEGLKRAVLAEAGADRGHCSACFTGRYPISLEEWWLRKAQEKLAFEEVWG